LIWLKVLALSARVGSQDTENVYCLSLLLLFRLSGGIHRSSERPVRSAFLELADAFPVRDANSPDRAPERSRNLTVRLAAFIFMNAMMFVPSRFLERFK
jgi:hypothetical protein